ncbi:MAG: undecaprenyl-phosphate glucose phosphotransferase [Bacteroidaceae bacterium]|nr:undecaprenyl-phosphate glucose phosphotransferase [Bacteroidaceae bacterium]
MSYQSSREFFYFKLPVFLVDLLICCTILFVYFRVLPLDHLSGLIGRKYEIGLYVFLTMSLLIAVSHIKIILHERQARSFAIFWRGFILSLLTFVIMIALVSVSYKVVPRQFIFWCALTASPLMGLWHYVAHRMVKRLRRLGRNQRDVVIVGGGRNAFDLYRELSMGRDVTGYRVTGIFTTSDEAVLPDGCANLGRVEQLDEWLAENRPDELYCALSPDEYGKTIARVVKECNDRFIDFCFVPSMDGYPRRHMVMDKMGNVLLLRLREEPLTSIFARIKKRVFDVVVSTLFLCTLFPFVLLFVWIGTTLTSPGPLFFRQKRTGYNGKSFTIYKFRSMAVNKDADKVQATKDDPRKTKFGNFLRRSSIDELPQFINVLLGDMSVIGPRPHMEHHTEMYSELINDYMVRHLAKPGITGWAQINGSRGETKTVEDMARRVNLDIWYIEHWTLLLDFDIFFKTFWNLLKADDKQAY